MHKAKLKQGTTAWEDARQKRIGSSEVFDIIRYYATGDELQNCGINAEALRAEEPYTTAWALYHKLLGDGLYDRESLPPELAEYGHAVESYGLHVLQDGRTSELCPGEVYVSDRLIVSLDISGISEEIDVRPFDWGNGNVPMGKKFVCEQKSIIPNKLKKGFPLKHLIQAQYQITMTKAEFYILQIMVLKEDTVFERGLIVGLGKASKKKMFKYLDKNMKVTHLYFRNNEQLAMLIKTCIERFLADVDNRREPTPYIAHDSQRNIISSIRINTHHNKDLVVDYDLSEYMAAKDECEYCESWRKRVLQSIVETAMENNATRFESADGTTASFSKDGKFLVSPPKEGYIATA